VSTIANEFDALVSTIEAATPSRVYDGVSAFRCDPDATDEEDVSRRSLSRTFMVLPTGDRQWLGDMAEQPEKRDITQTLQVTVLYLRDRRLSETIKVLLEDQDTLAAAIALPLNYAANVSLRRIGAPSVLPPTKNDGVFTLQIPVTITYDAE
jgi:hypothetical protein